MDREPVNLDDHNPDSNCVECCLKIEELHSYALGVLDSLQDKINSVDMEKFTTTLEKLQNNPLLKMLMK